MPIGSTLKSKNLKDKNAINIKAEAIFNTESTNEKWFIFLFEIYDLAKFIIK